MKAIIIRDGVLDTQLNLVLLLDVQHYLRDVGFRKGNGPTRHYMNHRGMEGYTRVRQTSKSIIAEWME